MTDATGKSADVDEFPAEPAAAVVDLTSPLDRPESNEIDALLQGGKQ